MRGRGRPFWFAVGVVVAVVALQTLWIRLEFGGPEASQAFGDLIPLPGCILGAIACWVVARRESAGMRRGWIFMGLASLSWGVGESMWSWYELVGHRDVPFPSAADVGYLGMIPFAFAAVLAFAGGRTMISSVRIGLQGFIIAGSVLFLSWMLLLGAAFRVSEGTLLEQIVALAYPVGDAVLIALVAFAVPRVPRRGRVPVTLVGVGLLLIAFADSGFTLMVQNDSYQTGNPIDVGWTAGFLVIWLAALSATRPTHTVEAEDHRPTRAPIVVTNAVVAITVVAAVVNQLLVGQLEPFLFWNAVAVIVAVLAYQFIVTWENLSLVRDLDARVHQRTIELRSALDEVEQVNRLQGAFVSSISHELRTPLTNLIGTASTLLRPELALPPIAVRLVQGSQGSAERLSRMIEDLLLVAGLDEGFATSPFDVVSQVRMVIDASAVSSRTVVDGLASLTGVGSATRFRIALSHVVANAEKFAPTGRIRVNVASRDDEAIVTVADEGPGVPDDRRDVIFERFVQADDSTTRTHDGAGLGLYIARRALGAINGRIWLEPSTGAGAIFALAIPAMPSVRSLHADEAHHQDVAQPDERSTARFQFS